MWRECGLGFLTAVNSCRVEGKQAGEHIVMSRRIHLRRNIDDDELVDRIRVGEGELHSNFSAHRMTQDVSRRESVSLCEFSDIFRHHLIVKDFTMRRTSVVALIKREDGQRLRKRLAQRSPVF